MTTKKDAGLHGFLGGPSGRIGHDSPQEGGEAPAPNNEGVGGKAGKTGKVHTVAASAKAGKETKASKEVTGSTPATARTARTVGMGEAKRTATTDLPPSLYDYARDAAYWRRETLTEIVERALRAELERVEQENGGPFDPRPAGRR
jgi:hypothetical protein